MTDFQKHVFAYGTIFVLLGLPLLWATLAMRRQLIAGNISRDPGNGASKLNPIARRSLWGGVLVATLVSAKGAFSKSQHLLGLALLIGAGFVLWQLYRLRQAERTPAS